MIDNSPTWVEIDVTGGSTNKYFGRFSVKPFLTHEEKADAVRLAERYTRGIEKSGDQRMFMTTLAFITLHIVETDAAWWNSKNGLDLIDEEPVYEIANKIGDIQNPKKEESETTTDEPPKV